METLWHDVRYAARMLAKTPALTAVIAITLAIGIGANTVIFSIVNGFLLRPLPVPHASQVVAVATEQKGAPLGLDQLSYADLRDFQSQLKGTFSSLVGYQLSLAGFNAGDHPVRATVSYVTGNYFAGLGVKPELGRLFFPGEGENSGAPSLVVLGYDFWKAQLGGDRTVVGREARVNGKGTTIIGVAPEGFHGTHPVVRTEIYLPLSMMAGGPSSGFWTDRGSRTLRVLGRMEPGVTLAQARSSTEVVAARVAAEYPKTDRGISMLVVPERLARPVAEAHQVVPVICALFLVLAGLVLLLACLNVANILLARSSVRRKEMAIRAALGAGRWRMIRQILTETIVVSLLGGAAGVVLADWASSAISSVPIQSEVPVTLNFAFDWRVFFFALAAAILGGLATGLWPALRAGRTNLGIVLHEGGRSDAANAGRSGMRNGLVAVQVAGALMLLIAAGFFVRTLQRLENSYMGFDPKNVVNVSMDPSEIGYSESQSKAFYRELKDRVAALPGVQSVSLAFSVPMGTMSDADTAYIENHPVPVGEQPPVLLDNLVGPNYFATMRTPLAQGRAFTKSDDEKAPLVAIVNQTMARRFWPNESAIGKRFSIRGQSGPFAQIVGVAANGKYETAYESSQPFFYLPLAQNFSPLEVLQVRSSTAPQALLADVQKQIRDLAPELPLFNSQTMEHSLEGPDGFLLFRLGAMLAGAMGLLGLVLAVVGVYGVISYSVSLRTHEIGIRMALGAQPGEILRRVLGQGLRLIGIGMIAGLVTGWALTRYMAHVFQGEAGWLTFLVAAELLGAVALWACYVPARRAMRLAPMAALRHE